MPKPGKPNVDVEISGEVAKPFTLDSRRFNTSFPLEERIYRMLRRSVVHGRTAVIGFPYIKLPQRVAPPATPANMWHSKRYTR